MYGWFIHIQLIGCDWLSHARIVIGWAPFTGAAAADLLLAGHCLPLPMCPGRSVQSHPESLAVFGLKSSDSFLVGSGLKYLKSKTVKKNLS